MNIKKMLLLSILTLSVATGVAQELAVPHNTIAVTGTLGSDEVQFVTTTEIAPVTDKTKIAWQANKNIDIMLSTTFVSAIPGALVGAVTGTSISYMAGKIFDVAIINALAKFYGETSPEVRTLARFVAQVGSKWFWEKPLRNKIINWLIADLKAKGVEFNEEFTKTSARLAAWVGTVSEMRSYWI